MSKDIGRHFNSDEHQRKIDVFISVLELVYAPLGAPISRDIHLQVKFDWMQELKTMLSFGMNSWDKAPTSKFNKACTASSRTKNIKSKESHHT